MPPCSKSDRRKGVVRCLLLMGCVGVLSDSSARAAEKVLPVEGEVFTVADHTAFLILPHPSAAGEPLPWVWYAPTLNRLPGKEETWMINKFLEAGIAVAGIDVGESFGSPDGRALYSDLYRELVNKRGLAKQACLLARSRGGLMQYSWAAENPSRVACIAGIYPVCNLSSYPGLARASGAYHLTEAELAARLTLHNPIDRLAPLAAAHVPIFHIHGDRDEVVPLEENSAVVARRYKELGGTMTLKVIPGQGHNMWTGWFEDEDLVNFVIANARKATAADRE